MRHSANYLMAAELAQDLTTAGPLIDVGSGVGIHSGWLAETLGRELWLVEPDPSARRAAARCNPGALTFASVEDLPTDAGAVVTAMEVIEHVAPAEQPRFVDQVARVTETDGAFYLSTPDESPYLGGHSGYTPHVGSLTRSQLLRHVGRRPGATSTWHLTGSLFHVGAFERVLLPPLNRLHGALRRMLPGVVDLCSVAVTSRPRQDAVPATPLGQDCVATRAHDPRSSGIFCEHRAWADDRVPPGEVSDER